MDWLSVEPAAGTNSGAQETVTVRYASENLAVGVHEGVLRVTVGQDGSVTHLVRICLLVGSAAGTVRERIVFSSDRGGSDLDLWTLDPETGDLSLLLAGPGDQISAKVSPDGRLLAYRDCRVNVCALVVRDLVTGAEMCHGDLLNPAWGVQTNLLIGNLAGAEGDVRQLMVGQQAFLLLYEPDRHWVLGVDRISGRVYYMMDPGLPSSTDLKVFDPQTGNRTLLLSADGQGESEGDVSVDGRRICYVKETGGVEGKGTLYRMAAGSYGSIYQRHGPGHQR